MRDRPAVTQELVSNGDTTDTDYGDYSRPTVVHRQVHTARSDNRHYYYSNNTRRHPAGTTQSSRRIVLPSVGRAVKMPTDRSAESRRLARVQAHYSEPDRNEFNRRRTALADMLLCTFIIEIRRRDKNAIHRGEKTPVSLIQNTPDCQCYLVPHTQ